MTEETNSLLDAYVERYKAGEGPDTLIPVFKEMCDHDPKDSAAWSCLSWLYLLDNDAAKAHKAAQKAVKLNPREPQSQINLTIAMLETGAKGVRDRIELVQRILSVAPEIKPDIEATLTEGLTRKPDWKSLSRVKEWLFPGNG